MCWLHFCPGRNQCGKWSYYQMLCWQRQRSRCSTCPDHWHCIVILDCTLTCLQCLLHRMIDVFRGQLSSLQLGWDIGWQSISGGTCHWLPIVHVLDEVHLGSLRNDHIWGLKLSNCQHSHLWYQHNYHRMDRSSSFGQNSPWFHHILCWLNSASRSYKSPIHFLNLNEFPFSPIELVAIHLGMIVSIQVCSDLLHLLKAKSTCSLTDTQ